jgi:hypothetical protein
MKATAQRLLLTVSALALLDGRAAGPAASPPGHSGSHGTRRGYRLVRQPLATAPGEVIGGFRHLERIQAHTARRAPIRFAEHDVASLAGGALEYRNPYPAVG